MRALLFVLGGSLLGVAALAQADQCQVVGQEVGDRAVAAIRASHGRVLAHCAPCGDPPPTLSRAFVPREARFTGDAVSIDGREVDLAYLYLEVAPNLFENIALRTGCPAEGIPEAFRVVGGALRPEGFGAAPPALAPLGWGRASSAPQPRPLPPG